ncbi:MAG: hypothetical protein GY941_30600, partial [Planctomycetes bacterium]|nr:hypothetical protein [Planctomycetota bacterium]
TNKTIDGDNNTISNLAIGAEVSGASTALSDTADITYNADFTSLANVLAIDQSLISGATPTFTTTNFTDASNKRFMSDAQETVLDSVETNADVTDTANVTAAGALMDSEVDADIKTLVLPASVTIGAYHSFLNTANETAFHQAVSLEPGVDIQVYDVDTLKADTDDTLTAGFAATGVSDGTKSSGTYTPAA